VVVLFYFQRTNCSRSKRVGVKYATENWSLTKTVTVTSNADGQATKILTIKGVVLGDDSKAKF
jgi:hypothetical protein